MTSIQVIGAAKQPHTSLRGEKVSRAAGMYAASMSFIEKAAISNASVADAGYLVM